ncbi:hypothetical protein [Ruminococcus sp. Marseille-P6503]|uniref:hypothetical protein n=1 Tax=Ruminococcus sp. Marseille-P6503 TaxID=2364796 RepID=UPI000F534250|nr:hypothetical protein [Ruminococcus sp. Marseille-P6503]
MVLIPVMESFDGILSDMTALIGKLEKNSGDFFNESVAFVRRLENTAENYRLPIAGELAVIRGKLLCGDEEALDTAMYQSRKERRNQKQRFILRQLEQAYSCVQKYFSAGRRLFTECEGMTCQVIVRLISKGLLKKQDPSELSGALLMKMASADPELEPALTHIKGMVGAVNANIIFEKTMSHAGVYEKEN